MKLSYVLRIILAVIVGEFLLIVLTTVAQEVLVDGVNWQTSSNGDLILGGSATLLAAVISGYIASLIVGREKFIPHIIISILISIETILLFQTGRFNEPLWFDFLASAMLILSVWIGYILFQKLNRHK